MTSRGIRNNNPGNIRHSADRWQGMTEEQPDKEFVHFAGPEFGIRAIVKILISYKRQGIATLRQMIDRWAPPSENDTDGYVRSVAGATHLPPDADVDMSSAPTVSALVRAIIQHENGSQPYSREEIAKGLALAGIPSQPTKET